MGLLSFVLLVVVAVGALLVLVGACQSETAGNPDSSPVPARRPAVLRAGNVPRPAPARPRARRPVGEAPRGYRLDAQKTIRAFDFILRSLGRTTPWQSASKMNDYIHDLTVMLEHGDLETSSLELLAADCSVVYRHEVRFGLANPQHGVDAARGIELPLLPPDRIAHHRLLVAPVRRIAEYRHRLRLPWSDADRLPERSGSRFASEHTRRVNRDRMSGQVFVSDEARRTATVITVSAAGDYAFARDPALPVNVFLHKAYCEQPIEFRPGMKLSFIIIQVPRGLQGRNIRQA